MRKTEDHFGDPIDCLAFAKRYQVVVVVYVPEVNIKQCCTFMFNGRPSHRTIHHFDGIRLNIMPVSSDVLELVRYRTDLTKTKVKKNTLLEGVAQGPGHLSLIHI